MVKEDEEASNTNKAKNWPEKFTTETKYLNRPNCLRRLRYRCCCVCSRRRHIYFYHYNYRLSFYHQLIHLFVTHIKC
jgi:hypothetical protein